MGTIYHDAYTLFFPIFVSAIIDPSVPAWEQSLLLLKPMSTS